MSIKPEGPRPKRTVIALGLPIALIGWASLAALVFLTAPFLFARWLFYFFLFLAITGTSLPLTWYLNLRFARLRFPQDGVLWRESMLVGFLTAFLVWLQTDRMLNAFLGTIFFAVLLIVEILLRIFEDSRWNPPAMDVISGDVAPGNPESAQAASAPEE